MKFGVSSEQESPKNRASGLVAGHQSLICGELHHPSGLQGKRFVRCRIGFTCCEFRPRRGNALGIWKRVESLLHKQWNPGATQGWLSGPQGRCVSCEWLGRSVDLDKRRGSAPRAGAAAWTGSTSKSRSLSFRILPETCGILSGGWQPQNPLSAKRRACCTTDSSNTQASGS